MTWCSHPRSFCLVRGPRACCHSRRAGRSRSRWPGTPSRDGRIDPAVLDAQHLAESYDHQHRCDGIMPCTAAGRHARRRHHGKNEDKHHCGDRNGDRTLGDREAQARQSQPPAPWSSPDSDASFQREIRNPRTAADWSRCRPALKGWSRKPGSRASIPRRREPTRCRPRHP